MHIDTFNQKIIFITLSIIALCVYFVHPYEYEYTYNLYCMLLYIFSFGLFLIFKKKTNYFDFDILFLITSFFAFFAYPVFLYPIDPYYFYVFQIGFGNELINQGTALALVGLEAYMTGSLFYNKSHIKSITFGFYPLKTYTIATFSLFLLFIVFGGYTFYRNMYYADVTGQTGIFAYINVLLITFLLSTICMQYSNLRYTNDYSLPISRIYKPFLLLIIAYVAIMLSTGTRTVPLQVVLAIIGLYALYYRPFSWKLTLIIIGIGVLVLATVVFLRGRNDNWNISNIFDVFMDIVIVNRNSFAAIDYVNNNGYTYGSSMLAYLLQPIPFAQSITYSIFNIDPNYTSSSLLLTTEALGDDHTWGLGTNIIADVYIAFGIIGVIIFMFFGGWFVAKAKELAKYKITYMVIYAVLIANSVFLVRAEFFYCLQKIIWCLIVFYFTKPLYKKKKRLKRLNRHRRIQISI